MTAFSNGMSLGHDSWVAVSSTIGAAGKARVVGVTH